jgi:hypothetical protein
VLTGKIADVAALRVGDARRNMPRFQGDNLRRNVELVEELKKLAAAENCTAAQLALAWVLSRAPYICADPGHQSSPSAGGKHCRCGDRDLGREAGQASQSVQAGRRQRLRYPENPLMRLGI